MSDRILVVGGNGHVGTPLVLELARRGEAVRIGSRNPTAPSVGVETARLDLTDPATFAAAFDGVGSAYILAPTGNADLVRLLTPVLDAAIARGVKVVLQTAMGVDADDSIPFRQMELKLERGSTPYVILRPNWFTDNLRSYWARDISEGVIQVPAGEGRTSFIDARDIAAAAAAALTETRFDRMAFDLTGPAALSYVDVADLLAKAAGRRIAYRSVDDEVFVTRRVADGFQEPYARLLAGIFYPVREGWVAKVTDAVETLTASAPRTVSAYVSENAAAFA
jgi:uncharacterized protein YbjT (DUF2867 family)